MRWILPFFFGLTQIISSQINENFNNGSFNANSNWIGTTQNFTINNANQLQLKALATTGESWLFTPSTAIENGNWELTINLGFDPSSQNYCRIYLTADNSDPSKIKNGFFIMMGGTDDDICLYKIENGTSGKIIDGANGRLSFPANEIKLMVSYSLTDGWILKSEKNSIIITEEYSNIKNSNYSHWFGIYCKYTSTRSDKFSFDNIIVSGSAYIPIIQPKVTTTKVLTNNQITLHFDNEICINETDNSCFDIDIIKDHAKTIGYGKDKSEILLNLTQALPDSCTGWLSISGIKGCDGIELNDTLIPLSYNRFKCNKVNSVNINSIGLSFNKKLQSTILTNQFKIEPGNIQPSKIVHKSETTIELQFDNPLKNGIYQIYISNLLNDENEVLSQTQYSLLIQNLKQHDIVITEFMCDPDPAVALPPTEYLELFNRTDFDINLSGYSLMVNGKKQFINGINLKPQSYICLIDDSDSALWRNHENIAIINTFPTLYNTEGNIALISNDNIVLDAVQYSTHWNENSFKDDGGWSFERLDNNNFSNSDNWQRSTNKLGGTPGAINSVETINIDNLQPYITSIEQKKNSVIINFSEPINFNESQMPIINDQSIKYTSLIKDTLFCQWLQLNFDSIPNNRQYELSWNSKPIDYAGNELKDYYPLIFGNTQKPEVGEIIINEILFNPLPHQADYVEIYNKSNHIFCLSDLYISRIPDSRLETLVKLSEKAMPVLPNSYFTISTNVESFLSKAENPWWLIENSTLPNLPSDKGEIALTLSDGTILDQLSYSEEFHFPLLSNKQGISLERINANAPTNNASNWHTASEQSGFGTPTANNSQSIEAEKSVNKGFTLAEELFTPNGDGDNDFMILQSDETVTGEVATITIYDIHGRAIKYLANNQLLGNYNIFKWDGTNNAEQKAPFGIYIVWIRTFNTAGQVKEQKLVTVLGQSSN